MDPIGVQRLLKESEQRLAIIERLQKRSNLTRIGEFWPVKEAAASTDDKRAAFLDPADRGVDKHLGMGAKDLGLPALLFDSARELVSNLTQRSTVDEVGQVVVDAFEESRLETLVSDDNAVLDAARGRHKDRKHALRVELQKPNLVQRLLIGGRLGCDRGGTREVAQQNPNLFDHIRIRSQLRDPVADRNPMLVGHIAYVAHCIDELSETQICRHTTGARVRLVQKPRVLEVGQLIADGRGRQANPIALGQASRTHRLTCGDVLGNRRE